MSERVRPSLLASLYESKRIMVATCAAIAMVLGATSVGASFFGHQEEPKAADMSSIFSVSSQDATQQAAPEPNSGNLIQQQLTLDNRRVFQPPATYNTKPTPSDSSKSKKNPLTEVLKSTAQTTLLQDQIKLLDSQATLNQTISEVLDPSPETSAAAPSTASISRPQTPAETESPTEPQPAAASAESVSDGDSPGGFSSFVNNSASHNL